ncbi:type I-E CRISPR-associated protein Cse2/CasB [Pyramidobacter sp. YE332]|uniref:type I-E CRISPR-associated protein Cse2/CasB n=1 Tax=unclassified Pyramidobacter TaxID=2632171 RepID=UPI00098FA154|nr:MULTISPECIES: type I-E CRISPR-associated protein Cse2/CasB [unclassified Pyramidobacter]OON87122.1 hypothetical protein B0D78_10750 [Pyramidobacter sp. C12-8]WOL40092.1 type I-E CRISPR-associated protein Cse2/CasB [Pyramidobacter sp. YE332]
MPAEKNALHVMSRYEKFFERTGELLMRMAPTAEEEQKKGYTLTRGERAELRRMNPTKNDIRPPVFWRLLCEYGILGDAENSLSEGAEKAWAAVLQGMAMTAQNCRGAQDDFGAALGSLEDAGDALARRFDLLMRTDGDRFFDLLRHQLKLACSKDCAFSWTALACLCVAPEENERSKVRSALTKSFYLALWKSQNTAGENGESIVKENESE